MVKEKPPTKMNKNVHNFSFSLSMNQENNLQARETIFMQMANKNYYNAHSALNIKVCASYNWSKASFLFCAGSGSNSSGAFSLKIFFSVFIIVNMDYSYFRTLQKSEPCISLTTIFLLLRRLSHSFTDGERENARRGGGIMGGSLECFIVDLQKLCALTREFRMQVVSLIFQKFCCLLMQKRNVCGCFLIKKITFNFQCWRKREI